jgi:hypothetical protein
VEGRLMVMICEVEQGKGKHLRKGLALGIYT